MTYLLATNELSFLVRMLNDQLYCGSLFYVYEALCVSLIVSVVII